MLLGTPGSDYEGACRSCKSTYKPAMRRHMARRCTGGVYHGKVVFPPSYPFKPPSILMLTPNGRFAVNTRLCAPLWVAMHQPYTPLAD